MKTMKRILVSCLLSIGLLAGTSSAAYADFQTVVDNQFYLRDTCMARGYYLELTTSTYYNPTCTLNSSGRWTLRMWVHTRPGGGGGSWSVPVD